MAIIPVSNNIESLVYIAGIFAISAYISNELWQVKVRGNFLCLRTIDSTCLYTML